MFLFESQLLAIILDFAGFKFGTKLRKKLKMEIILVVIDIHAGEKIQVIWLERISNRNNQTKPKQHIFLVFHQNIGLKKQTYQKNTSFMPLPTARLMNHCFWLVSRSFDSGIRRAGIPTGNPMNQSGGKSENFTPEKMKILNRQKIKLHFFKENGLYISQTTSIFCGFKSRLIFQVMYIKSFTSSAVISYHL